MICILFPEFESSVGVCSNCENSSFLTNCVHQRTNRNGNNGIVAVQTVGLYCMYSISMFQGNCIHLDKFDIFEIIENIDWHGLLISNESSIGTDFHELTI